MKARFLLGVAAPSVVVGLLLLAACFAGALYINRLQRNLAEILTENVTSLREAQELEIRVRQLRFHSLLYLIDPSPARLTPIADDERRFEQALQVVRVSPSAEEQACVQAIEARYAEYQSEQARLREEIVTGRTALEILKLAESHPIRGVVDPCLELSRINTEKMEQIARESQTLAIHGRLAMALLGVLGPIGGLVLGYGVARGLRRSIYKLSVRVQDMAQHLENDIATVSVDADGDLHVLDTQMQQIVGQVEAAAARLQSQQRELIRAEQLATVGKLAAGIAHEVRNPLTGIKMLVEAARRDSNARPLDSDDLDMIHREIARLERTVQGLLDYARLPAPQRTACEVGDLVQQAYDLVRTRAENQSVAIVCHDPGHPVVVSVDRSQIHTVFVNLFLNALDAMPTGGILDVAWESLPDSQTRVTISDTGPGIPDEIMGQLFAPFATTKATGTGLGLSLAARIVQEHHGSIRVENRPHGGACFTIVFQRLQAENGCDNRIAH